MWNLKLAKLRAVAVVLTSAVVFSCGGEDVEEFAPEPRPDAEVLGGPFTPANGQTLLFIGQDSGTIADYAAAMPEHQPAGITLYTSLRAAEPEQTLDGIFSDSGDRAGKTRFDETLAQFPGAALAIGLSLEDSPTCMSTHTSGVAAGNYDESLNRLVAYLAGLAPRQVFLRIGYEFDGPWNCYRPEPYKLAFRHIAEALRSAGADNVTTVWQSANWPDPGIAGEGALKYDHLFSNHLERWYPGDDVVDWLGMSVFYRDISQWGYEPPDHPARTQEKLLAFARFRGKPVMIAEAAPQGYRTGALTRSPIHNNTPQPVTAEEIWAGWYEPFFEFVHANRDAIRAVAYINTWWESQPMWQCEEGFQAGTEGCSGGNWGDSRVQANPLIRERWLAEILDSDFWVQASSDS